MAARIPEIGRPEIMDHGTSEPRQYLHVIRCLGATFPVMTIQGKQLGTRDMEPLPDASNPHPGLVYVKYLRFCQEFSYPFFNPCKILVTILHCLDQCSCTDGMPKNI
jgi:hypothetical protein